MYIWKSDQNLYTRFAKSLF